MDLQKPKVFVIVLNYNGGKIFLDCLSGLFLSDYPNFEVVVVDNNSTDGSFEQAKRKWSKFHFIKSRMNSGFAVGNNLGIRFALEKGADFVFILNNDAYVEPDTISKLVGFSLKNQPCLCSPLVLNPDGKIWFSGGKIDWLRMKAYHSISKSPQYLCGCALFVDKTVFKTIGLFDEDYFLYYEDADFSIRAARKGFKLLIADQIKVIHHENSSQNIHKIYWLVLSGIIFFKKRAPFYLKPWLFIYLLGRKLKNRLDLYKSKTPLAKQIQKAYQDAKNFHK